MNRLALGLVAVAIVAAAALAFVYLQPNGTGTILFEGVRLKVELATTSTQWERGLSGRSSMPQNEGMLFVFDHADTWQFWMRGMEFPLDIVWFDANHTVIYFVQDLPLCPVNGCPTYTPPRAAYYALEVNAGFVIAHEVSIGDSFSQSP